MPMFLIERSHAERIDVHVGGFAELNAVNDAEGVRWLYSFLSLDRRKTYCLYEAPSADWIRRAAVAAGIPADVIVEVAGKVTPEGLLLTP